MRLDTSSTIACAKATSAEPSSVSHALATSAEVGWATTNPSSAPLVRIPDTNSWRSGVDVSPWRSTTSAVGAPSRPEGTCRVYSRTRPATAIWIRSVRGVGGAIVVTAVGCVLVPETGSVVSGVAVVAVSGTRVVTSIATGASVVGDVLVAGVAVSPAHAATRTTRR